MDPIYDSKPLTMRDLNANDKVTIINQSDYQTESSNYNTA